MSEFQEEAVLQAATRASPGTFHSAFTPRSQGGLWSLTAGHALCMSSLQELPSLLPLASEHAGTGRGGFQIRSVQITPGDRACWEN